NGNVGVDPFPFIVRVEKLRELQLEPGRHHAHDCECVTVDRYCLADHIRVAIEPTLKQVPGEHDRMRLARSKETAKRRVRSSRAPKLAAHPRDPFCRA